MRLNQIKKNHALCLVQHIIVFGFTSVFPSRINKISLHSPNASKLFVVLVLSCHSLLLLLIWLLHDKLLLWFHLLLALLLSLLLVLLLLLHKLVKHLWVVIVNVLIYSCLQSLHQLFLYFLLDVCCYQCFCLSHSISPLCLLLYGHKLFSTLKFKLSHLN
jgi:hypothetical protein